MTTDEKEISYPRLRVRRFLARLLGRLLLPVIFRVRIFGKENFPPSGPLIVVGNHTAIMEVVMMVVFTPWQVEILGGGDIRMNVSLISLLVSLVISLTFAGTSTGLP